MPVSYFATNISNPISPSYFLTRKPNYGIANQRGERPANRFGKIYDHRTGSEQI